MRIHLGLATLAALALTAPAAQAATPATGDVSADHLTTSWGGTAYGQPTKDGAEFQTHANCVAPLCDTFTLNVKDAGNLKVDLNAPRSAQYVDVLVTHPDGSTDFLAGNDTDNFQEIIFENAAKGAYTFDIWPNELPDPTGIFYDGAYNGTAELCMLPMSQCFLPPPDDEGDDTGERR